jgi:hypothetical protein
MDEASYLLKNIVDVQQQLPTGYRKLSPNPPLVDEMVILVDQVVNFISYSVDPVDKVVNLILSSVDPTLPSKSETQMIGLSTSLVDSSHQVVDSISPSVNPPPPLKSEDVAQVFLVTTDSSGQGGIPPVPTTPSPNNVITIDWNSLRTSSSFLRTFPNVVQVFGRNIPNTIIYEGAFVSILSLNAWKALGSPQLASMTHNLLAFNRRVSQHLGILHQFLVTLGGEMVYIDVMVVHDPLDFNFLLG